MSKTYSKTRILVECALMIAIGTVLSNIKIFTMPNGGSVTLLSMLPFVLVSFRHGVKWGLFTGFVNGCLQLIMGFYPPPASTVLYFAGEVLLDYLLAFTVLGFACLIAKPFRNRTVGVGVSAFVVCLLRFLCSFLSGYIVWKDYDYAFSWMTEIGFPGISNMSVDGLCWLYSAVYNATYMLPEAILTTVLVVILIRVAPQIFDPQNARA